MLDGKPISHDETMKFLDSLEKKYKDREKELTLRKQQEKENKLDVSNKIINLSAIK